MLKTKLDMMWGYWQTVFGLPIKRLLADCYGLPIRGYWQTVRKYVHVLPISSYWQTTDALYKRAAIRGCPHITSAAGGGEGVSQMLTIADEGGREG